MDRVMIFDQTINKIGYYSRHSTHGEEYNLVKEFIDYYWNVFLKNNRQANLAIFVEPKIASGFPDIVFATYSKKIMDYWSDAREKLSVNDLKIMSHLIMAGGSTGNELISGLKMSEKTTLQSLEKLLDANMISRKNGLWKAKEKQRVYSIKKLVSVEAKMTDMKKVAEQSFINTWFASQSYALINTSNPQKGTIKNFEKKGIGLYCKKKNFAKLIEAKRLQLPSSYQSLQFNEWIGKSIAQL